MTRPLSDDLRRRVVTVVDDGMSRRGAAKRFGIAPSTAIKWVRAWRLTGSYRPRAQGGDRRSQRIEARVETVLALVEETPDMTLAEIVAHLESEHGVRVSQSTVWRFFHRRGITFKKTAHASEQQRPDVLRRRRAWFETQPALNPGKLIFVDETGASTKMARRGGRALRGHRCRAPVPHGHWKTTTFVGALRLGGMTAPMVLDGAMWGWAPPLRVTACRHARVPRSACWLRPPEVPAERQGIPGIARSSIAPGPWVSTVMPALQGVSPRLAGNTLPAVGR